MCILKQHFNLRKYMNFKNIYISVLIQQLKLCCTVLVYNLVHLDLSSVHLIQFFVIVQNCKKQKIYIYLTTSKNTSHM